MSLSGGSLFSPNFGDPRSFCKNEIIDDFLNLIQYFFLHFRLLEINFRHIKYLKNMFFWARYDFSNSYLLCMMDSGHLNRWSVLKILLSTTRPWIHFLCDIDTLMDVCDFLYNFMWRLIIFFKKFVYAWHYFFLYQIWTFWKFWVSLLQFFIGMSVWILVSCSRCLGVVSWNFFVIKFHSKIVFF